MRRDTNITHRYPSMGGHILFPLLRLVPAMEILVHPLSPSAIGVRLRHALGPAGGNKLVIPIPRALVTPPIGPRLGYILLSLLRLVPALSASRARRRHCRIDR
eukprot:3589982-Pyramimonas_sp.AAC.1